jgi:hypothetical protein
MATERPEVTPSTLSCATPPRILRTLELPTLVTHILHPLVHHDFSKPDGRCFMACTFFHSSHIHIAWNCNSFIASSHFRVSLSVFRACHSLHGSFSHFCIAPCFICFYRFLSRLEVHLCDISICVGEETFDNEANYYHIILSQDLVNDLK